MSTTTPPPLVVPDYMGDLRTWLRDHAQLKPLLAARVFFRIPEQPVFPLLRLVDAGTTVQPGEVPVWDARLSMQVWGAQPADYATVSTTALSLASVLQATGSPFRMGATTEILAITGVTVRDNADPDTGAPRRIVDALFTLRSTGPADTP